MSVFISYNHRDEQFVARLALELANNNVKVWKDSWRIGIGDSILQRIQEGLEKANFVCVVLSKHSLESEWVRVEIRAGLLREIEERTVRILPVVIDDSRLPLLLRDKVFADFRQDFDAGLKKLLAVLLPYYEVQAGGRISSDDRYFIHFSCSTRTINERLVCEIDVVSFDLEETYSILTQVRCEGTEVATLTNLDVASESEVTDLILDACIDEFAVRPARIAVSPGKAARATFSLNNAQGTMLFNASVSIKALGEFRRGGVLFNVGALFSQIRGVRQR